MVGDQTTPPSAVLWDMDGTLVDTEPYWMETEFALAAEYGGTWSQELALELVGNDLITSGRFIRRHMGIDLTPEEIVERLLDGVVARVRNEVPWRPGARELLEALREASVPTALVTMSIRSMADDVIAAIPFDAFDAIVTGDVVANPKPHPEPYLVAAAELGVDVRDCVAIEDSPAGLTSAWSAGAVTVGVPNFLALEEAPAHVLWPTLADKSVADVAELVAVHEGRA